MALSSAAAASPFSFRRAAITTRIPAWQNTLAQPNPMPVLPPVTMATFPRISSSMGIMAVSSCFVLVFDYWFLMASSKATSEAEKLIFLVKAQASVPPNTRSMPLSSHSMDRGPV